MGAGGQPGGNVAAWPDLAALRTQLREATLRPEAGASGELMSDLEAVQAALAGARARAARWVAVARADQRSRPLVDRMLEQFPLDSAQGRALMSLAEGLLRTPDAKRADQLIAERLAAIRDAGVRGDTDLLLRTGFTLLSAAGRLLPEVLGRAVRGGLGGESHQARGRPDRARGAAPVDADPRACVHRRRDDRRSACPARVRSRTWRCAPSTCSARARAPTPTRSATSRIMRTPSTRSAGSRPARCTRARGSRSSCRRSSRATPCCRASASTSGSARVCSSSRAAPPVPASA